MMDVQADRYGVTRFTGGVHEIVDAWDRAFAAWLRNSGYEPDDRPRSKLYRGDKARRFRCDLCLPARPL